MICTLTTSFIIVPNGCEFEKVKFDFFKFVVLGQSRRAGRGLLKFAAVLEKPEGIFENGSRLAVSGGDRSAKAEFITNVK